MQNRRAASAVIVGVCVATSACGASTSDVTATHTDRLPNVSDEPPATDAQPFDETDEALDHAQVEARPPIVVAAEPIDADLIDPAVIDLLIPDTFELPAYETSLLDANVPIELVASYDSVLQFEATGYEDGELVSAYVEFAGIVDRVSGLGELSISATQLATFDDRVEIHPDVEEVVWVQSATVDDQYAFGLLGDGAPTAAPGWTHVSSYDSEFTPVFFEEGGLTLDSLGDLLYEDPASWATDQLGGGRFETSVDYFADETLSYADGSIVDVAAGSTGPVRMRIEHDETGVVHVLVIEADYADADPDEDGPLSIRLQVDYTYPGTVEAIREPVDVAPSEPVVVTNVSIDEDEAAQAMALRPEIELKIIGAWERENHEMLVSVRRDGRVTIVTDRSVLSSTDDFRSLWLTEQGRQRLRDELEATGAFDQPGPQDGGRVGPDLAYAELTIDGDRKFSLGDYHPDRSAGAEPGRREAEVAVALLTDLAWLDDTDIATPIGPWIPDAMWVSARPGVVPRSGLPAPTDVAVWPYAASIEEMSTSAGSNAYDEPTLDMCLEGDEVAPLFEMLTGVNHAYLRVDNRGEVWELNVQPSIPGAGSNRC